MFLAKIHRLDFKVLLTCSIFTVQIDCVSLQLCSHKCKCYFHMMWILHRTSAVSCECAVTNEWCWIFVYCILPLRSLNIWLKGGESWQLTWTSSQEAMLIINDPSLGRHTDQTNYTQFIKACTFAALGGFNAWCQLGFLGKHSLMYRKRWIIH